MAAETFLEFDRAEKTVTEKWSRKLRREPKKGSRELWPGGTITKEGGIFSIIFYEENTKQKKNCSLHQESRSCESNIWNCVGGEGDSSDTQGCVGNRVFKR
ncbi:uncharacterized protein LOC111240911 isoform X2 [Vigna radiata var. radiata]|nr:uncharacterized protein LOC111240911 isoform X2 [Vigna radiata var. radiata]